jgi:hypothetical protein
LKTIEQENNVDNPINRHIITAQQNKKNLVQIFEKFNPGDIVNSFELVQKLDSLGLKKMHFNQQNWLGDHSINTDPALEHPYHLLITSNISSADNATDQAKDSDQKYLTILNKLKPLGTSSYLRNNSFFLDENIFHGGHGEIWRAHKVNRQGEVSSHGGATFIRMRVRDRPHILQCALREIFFGELLVGQQSMARYVTYFTTEDDYWLVFRDEG